METALLSPPHPELISFDEALRGLALELRTFVADLRAPRSQQSDWWRRAYERCQDLRSRFVALREELGELTEALSPLLAELLQLLEDCAAELAARTRGRLRQMRASLSQSYEDFVVQLRSARGWSAADLKSLRALRLPRRVRSLFHAAMALGCVLLYQFVLPRDLALQLLAGAAGIFATLEITRRIWSRWNDLLVDRVFGLISRPRERYQINSATWFLSATALIAWIAPKPAVCVALLVLGFGDPIASWVGYHLGKLKLRGDKSLAGTLAFAGAAFAASFTYLILAQPQRGLGALIAVSAAVAAVGALVELFAGRRIDDNFAIPVVCALVATLWF